MENAKVQKNDGRKWVETRVMVGTQIISVGAWFSQLVTENQALEILRARYCPKLVSLHPRRAKVE